MRRQRGWSRCGQRCGRGSQGDEQGKASENLHCFHEDLNGVEGWRETSEGMLRSLLAPNIYSQATLLRAQSAVLPLHKEATIVNLHNSTCYS